MPSKGCSLGTEEAQPRSPPERKELTNGPQTESLTFIFSEYSLFFLSAQEAKQLHTVIYIALTFLIIGAVCLCFDMWSISSHTSLPVTWVIGVGRGAQLSASLRCSPCRISSVFSLCSSTGSKKALAMLWRRERRSPSAHFHNSISG